jgi:hypothetical protein
MLEKGIQATSNARKIRIDVCACVLSLTSKKGVRCPRRVLRVACVGQRRKQLRIGHILKSAIGNQERATRTIRSAGAT